VDSKISLAIGGVEMVSQRALCRKGGGEEVGGRGASSKTRGKQRRGKWVLSVQHSEEKGQERLPPPPSSSAKSGKRRREPPQDCVRRIEQPVFVEKKKKGEKVDREKKRKKRGDMAMGWKTKSPGGGENYPVDLCPGRGRSIIKRMNANSLADGLKGENPLNPRNTSHDFHSG